MLEKIFNIKNLANFLILISIATFTSLSILLMAPNYLLVIVVVVGAFCLLFVWSKPFVLLQILILVMPFTEMSIFQMSIMGVPGLKPINILFILVLFSFVHKRISPNANFNEKLFVVGMLSILLIAVFRSMPHISIINKALDENFGYFRLFQSFYLKSVIYFSFFIFISFYVSNIEKVELLLKTFIWSILLFSIFFLGIYVFVTPDKTSFYNIRESFSSVLHLHGNNIATIYMLSFPLIISYYYMKKNVFSIVTIIMCLICIGLLYSRTAYALVLVSIFMYLYFSKRLNWTPVIVCVLLLGINFLPSSIAERALYGIETKDADEISAGRMSGIWVPLIEEIVQSPEKLIFGSGRRAILFSDARRQSIVYMPKHAHNLYLNTVLEIGVLGLTFFGIIYIFFINNVFKSIKNTSYPFNEKEILIGVIVATFCFLLAGLTGRQLFPIIYNYPLWIVLAIGSAILKFQAKKDTV